VAFKAIADRHHFPPDFPSPQAAVASMERRLSHAGYYGVVAGLEGRIVGTGVPNAVGADVGDRVAHHR
jgi:ketosteroid isomerase-like protein